MTAPVRPKPAYVGDDPIMAGAFAAFVTWAWGQEEMHAAFAEETGVTRHAPAKTVLDAMIDDATGVHRDYADRFVAWLVREHWGEEGDPRLDEEGL